jgi:hypothetical protein
MRRREPEGDRIGYVMTQAMGYLAVTAAVVWLLLRFG